MPNSRQRLARRRFLQAGTGASTGPVALLADPYTSQDCSQPEPPLEEPSLRQCETAEVLRNDVAKEPAPEEQGLEVEVEEGEDEEVECDNRDRREDSPGDGSAELAAPAAAGSLKRQERAKRKLERLKRKKSMDARRTGEGKGGASQTAGRGTGADVGGAAVPGEGDEAPERDTGEQGKGERRVTARREGETGERVHPLRVRGQRPGEACFVCKREGHSARDCPIKQQQQQAKLARMVCLFCRQRGHALSACPEASKEGLRDPSSRAGSNGVSPVPEAGTGGERGGRHRSTGAAGPGLLCYNCGERGHHRDKCTQPVAEGGAQHALCFVCKQSGHLSRDCPQNPHGLYPKGGACKKCGQKTHLAKDCPSKLSNRSKPGSQGPAAEERGPLEGDASENIQGKKNAPARGSGPSKRKFSGDALEDDFGDNLLHPVVKKRHDGDGDEV